jgi:hypothetical protein
MNRLNQTEPATFSILPFWAIFRDSVFIYFNLTFLLGTYKSNRPNTKSATVGHSIMCFRKRANMQHVRHNCEEIITKSSFYFSLLIQQSYRNDNCSHAEKFVIARETIWWVNCRCLATNVLKNGVRKNIRKKTHWLPYSHIHSVMFKLCLSWHCYPTYMFVPFFNRIQTHHVPCFITHIQLRKRCI